MKQIKVSVGLIFAFGFFTIISEITGVVFLRKQESAYKLRWVDESIGVREAASLNLLIIVVHKILDKIQEKIAKKDFEKCDNQTKFKSIIGQRLHCTLAIFGLTGMGESVLFLLWNSLLNFKLQRFCKQLNIGYKNVKIFVNCIKWIALKEF